MRLHHRIVVPFAVVAIVTTLAVAWVAFDVTSSTVTRHIRQDVIGATEVVSRSGMALNPAILAAMKEVSGAEVVTFGPGGLMATTLTGSDRDVLIERVIAGARSIQIAPNAPSVLELSGDASYFVAYRPVEGQPDVVVALLHEKTEVDRANRMLMRTILGAAALSLVLMLVVSQFVARRVTAPITRLAEFAQTVSPAKSRARAESGPDEVGRLGAAFNDMLERLDASQAALVKSEKLSLAGLFAAGVAHDVRNPLSSIKMQTQLLNAQAAPGSEAKQMTEAMLLDIAQVEFVVKDLLEVARPGELRREPHHVNAVLEGVIRQITPQCRHRRIRLTEDLARDLPVLSIDPDRLTQAFLNVAVNATEALREDGTLHFSSRLSAGQVIVEIDDDGAGLKPEDAARVFDPFVTSKPGGVGLGLVNARATIESHGGTIALAPRLPRGTRAVITLPVNPATGGDHG
jgi:signal transduction histidine kinase